MTGHDGHDAVPNKRGAKVHFTPSKAIFATADESDSDKNTELSADGDKVKIILIKWKKNNDDNKSKVNSGQFETFVSSVKGSLKVSDFVLYKVLLVVHQNSKFLRFTSLVKSSKKWNQHH